MSGTVSNKPFSAASVYDSCASTCTEAAGGFVDRHAHKNNRIQQRLHAPRATPRESVAESAPQSTYGSAKLRSSDRAWIHFTKSLRLSTASLLAALALGAATGRHGWFFVVVTNLLLHRSSGCLLHCSSRLLLRQRLLQTSRDVFRDLTSVGNELLRVRLWSTRLVVGRLIWNSQLVGGVCFFTAAFPTGTDERAGAAGLTISTESSSTESSKISMTGAWPCASP